MNIFDLVLVQPVFNLLMWLYAVIPGGDFGLTIILFTIVVRFALYPLVKRQLHQSRAMRKIQPELVKIRKKAKGNKQLQGMMMLEVYKEHNIKPFRSILILLIQLPIFIALYRVIQIVTTHREQVADYAYSFTEHLEPVRQLIEHPDQFNATLLNVIDLTQPAISANGADIALIILALIAAGTQYVMSKQISPKSEDQRKVRDIMSEAAQGKEPDQAELSAAMANNMMKILPFFMFLIMVSVPGALALYYGVSNLVAVLQQSYILRKDESELEDLALKGARNEAAKKAAKKATHKAREKSAQEAVVVDQPKTKATTSTKPTVTRITAKDTGKRRNS